MRTCAVLMGLLVCASGAWCQTREQTEARLSQLPPDQRAYERFRYWLSMLPANEQRQADLGANYRAYLRGHGFTDAEIDTEIKTVEEKGRQLEVERWNRILTAENPAFNVKPNAFLVEMVKRRKPGTALDVGMGQGRNAIYLAQQGWQVTGFDPAEKAVALARTTAEKLGLRLNLEVTTEENFQFGERRWDLVLLSYVGARGMEERVIKALKPGGIVIVEAFHRDATKGRSIGGAVVFETGELVTLFPGLRVVRYEEPVETSDFGLSRVRLVRYCAEKTE